MYPPLPDAPSAPYALNAATSIESARDSEPSARLAAPTPLAAATTTPRYPASVHFAFISGLLLPLAVIPYILTRRQTAHLRRRLHETDRVIQALRTDLRATALELDKARAAQARGTAEFRAILQRVREEVKEESGKVREEAGNGQKALLEYVGEVEREVGMAREAHAKAMGEVGRSLGTVAGFMHEVELGLGMASWGKDSRGADVIRAAAARLSEMDKKPKKSDDDAGGER